MANFKKQQYTPPGAVEYFKRLIFLWQQLKIKDPKNVTKKIH